ncbi:universal stress protein [Pokkaliibacter sp. CJK22405]|uniref:universal stress protein n=1 Tax=Pokkaliibacter sp. CJK22405 TaxID=3384615 RepID=UPI003984B25A
MFDLNTILYASDLGSNSRPAFRMAVKLAAENNASLTFLHVIEPLNNTAENVLSNYLSDKMYREIKEAGINELKSTMEERIRAFCKDELPQDFHFPKAPNVRVAMGNVEEEILSVADLIKADMIVMGTRTHDNITRLLLGSSAQRVLQRSSKPVLVVPLEGKG